MERQALQRQLEATRDELTRKLQASEEERVKLRAKVAQLDGGASEMEALLNAQAEVEKERRVELLRRQIARRIMNQSITRGWAAWHEMWSAKTHAYRKLRACGNRLHAPKLSQSFSHWQARRLPTLPWRPPSHSPLRRMSPSHLPLLFSHWQLDCVNEAALQARKELQAKMRKEAGLKEGALSAAQTLQQRLAELERQLLRAEQDKASALQRQLVELTGTNEEVLAMREAREREERIEMLGRQSVRRMLNAGLVDAWSAWFDLWSDLSPAPAFSHLLSHLRPPSLPFCPGSTCGARRATR